MNRLMSERLAIRIMLAIFSLILIFHLLVLFSVIPYDIVWGGRLKSRSQMVQFEFVSLLLNGLMLLIVLMRAGIVGVKFPASVFQVAFWCMAVLFLMNSVGNILSNNKFEQATFTPVTALLFWCSVRLAMSKSGNYLSNFQKT